MFRRSIRISPWDYARAVACRDRFDVIYVDSKGQAKVVPAAEPSEEEVRVEFERSGVKWLATSTETLLLMARQKEQISAIYIPEGFAGQADFLVVWPEGVWATDDLEAAAVLKFRFGAQIIRNPDKKVADPTGVAA